MIVVNRSNTTISGSYGNESFSVPFDKDLLDKMKVLEDKANEATSVQILKDIEEEFAKLTIIDVNAIIETKVKNVYKSVEGNYYLKTGNVVSSVPMPQALVQRLEDSLDNNIDATPLIKFYTRFLRNPKLRKLDKDQQLAFSTKVFNYINLPYTNQEQVNKLVEQGYTNEVAVEMATVPQVQVTKEGLLRTFKVSTELTKRFRLNDKGEKEQYDPTEGTKEIDEITGLITYKKIELTNEERVFEPAVQGKSGDEFLCGDKLGHIIKVGKAHSITWDQINTNDNSSCVPGLHCGGLTYIKGYQSNGTCTHNILVDPMNIGAVPCDTNGAIRVVEYFVLDEFSGVNGSIYHSSSYGAQTDSKWDLMRTDIIKQFGTLAEEKAKQIAKASNELNAI